MRYFIISSDIIQNFFMQICKKTVFLSDKKGLITFQNSLRSKTLFISNESCFLLSLLCNLLQKFWIVWGWLEIFCLKLTPWVSHSRGEGVWGRALPHMQPNFVDSSPWNELPPYWLPLTSKSMLPLHLSDPRPSPHRHHHHH